MGGSGVEWTSIDAYCSTELNHRLIDLAASSSTTAAAAPSPPDDDDYWSIVLASASASASSSTSSLNNVNNRKFLKQLKLPAMHPFCSSSNISNNNNSRTMNMNTNTNMTMNMENSNDHHATTTSTTTTTIPPMGSFNLFEEIFQMKPITTNKQGQQEGYESSSSSSSNIFTIAITLWYLLVPALLAMCELWVRLFAGYIGPIGIMQLVKENYSLEPKTTMMIQTKRKPDNNDNNTKVLSIVIILTVVSTLVIMTDTLYVLQNGPLYGAILFVTSILVSYRLCYLKSMQLTTSIVSILLLVAIYLITNITRGTDGTGTGIGIGVQFGNPADEVKIQEGLYYDENNTYISQIVQHWSHEYRRYDDTTRTYDGTKIDHDYDYDHDTKVATPGQQQRPAATSWITTGDGRTGLPFILNKYDLREYPTWVRVFLQVPANDDTDTDTNSNNNNHNGYNNEEMSSSSEYEYIALDISFPTTDIDTDTDTIIGHDTSKPMYLILHGLSGGSQEEYIRDMTIRRNKEGSTVIVMVARGMMDLPIQGYHIFHGARTSDVHTTATIIKQNTIRSQSSQQILIGVGYSMGGIIISNYVGRYGTECALDGAIAISGGLDMRYQKYAYRAQRLWQPLLTNTLRNDFLLGKFGHRIKSKVSAYEFQRILQATHITVRSICMHALLF